MIQNHVLLRFTQLSYSDIKLHIGIDCRHYETSESALSNDKSFENL